MYKDKDKQREAVKLAVRRHRAKGITPKGITGITEQGITTVQPSPLEVVESVTADIKPEPPIDYRPKPIAVKTQSHNPMMVGYVPPGATT